MLQVQRKKTVDTIGANLLKSNVLYVAFLVDLYSLRVVH